MVKLEGQAMTFLQPVAGEENGVIQLYSALGGRLPDTHFAGYLKPLKAFWPRLLSVTVAEVSHSFPTVKCYCFACVLAASMHV